jgi:hypothetical protein
MNVFGTLLSAQQDGHCPLVVNVNGATATSTSNLTFSDSLTLTVQSITPSMGTTAGGTNISITGTGFGANVGGTIN